MPIISGRVENEILFISIAGDIDMFTSGITKKELWNSIQNKKLEGVRVDLRDCNYIDSSGIGILISFIKLLKKSGTTVWVEGTNEEILTTLKLASLEKLFLGFNYESDKK